jgi:3-oxoacyl-[acyl-carrier protein] reductase
MVERVVREFGRIDVLVNNAGIVFDKDFEERTVEDWRRTLDVNLIGTFLVSKYVGAVMMKQKYGKIVNASSTSGIDSLNTTSVDYDASKAAIISLTRNLATQFAPYVNVNATALGWADTDMNKDLPADYLVAEKEKILKGRFANPREVAYLSYFLASDEAEFINGEVIKIDGGRR